MGITVSLTVLAVSAIAATLAWIGAFQSAKTRLELEEKISDLKR